MIASGVQRRIKTGVILLAAGASSRMKQPKLLLPWGPTTVLGHLIQLWKKVKTEQISVVCAAGDEALERELDRLGFPDADRIVNPFSHLGMFSSIQVAARSNGWKPSLTQFAIVLGDQPQLTLETLSKLVRFAETCAHPVCQPSYQGHARHPVIVSRQIFQLLATSTADHMKHFLQQLEACTELCEINDPGLVFDLDTPADYEKAMREFAPGVAEDCCRG